MNIEETKTYMKILDEDNHKAKYKEHKKSYRKGKNKHKDKDEQVTSMEKKY